MVRVRIAPSPTGYFHMGTARSALMVWLFARKNKGKFILRIEDTDKERSKKEFEDDIVAGIKALGLDYDEFYRQSERYGIYREHLDRLVAEDKAYYCFCSKEELEDQKKEAEKAGEIPKYGGKCANLSKEEIERNIKNKRPFVIRLRMPKEKISWEDIIRGFIEFDADAIGDIVIAKNKDEPLYNFTAVVDDILMGITHIIRGEDHISNTPKQIALYKAIGANIPKFAHLPLILSSDRSKMSKRSGGTPLKDYLSDGYFPEAIINFLVLIGWHPKNNREIFSKEDLISEFELEHVQKGGAAFDPQKLNWLNRKYISGILSAEEVARRGQPFVPEEWKLTPSIIAAVRERINKLSEIKNYVEFFFVEPEYPKEILFWKGEKGNTGENLKVLSEKIMEVDENSFNKENLERAVMAIVPSDKKGEYLWPLRVALSGKEQSPGPFEIMEALGRKKTAVRISTAMEKIS